MDTNKNEKDQDVNGRYCRTVLLSDVVRGICAQIIEEGFDARRKRIEAQAKRKGNPHV